MSDDLTRLIIGSLATWRLASLLVHERGPFDVFVSLRSAIASTNNATLIGIVGCTDCASIYIGIGVSLILFSVESPMLIFIVGLGLSGATIGIDRVIRALQTLRNV